MTPWNIPIKGLCVVWSFGLKGLGGRRGFLEGIDVGSYSKYDMLS